MSSFVYRWDNIVTKEYYIGVHQGTPDDGYIGSGILFLRKYKSKKDQFVRIIIETFENKEDAYNFERELVNETTLLDTKCLNLKIGGEGGGIHIHTETMRKRHSNKMKEIWSDDEYKNKTISAMKDKWTTEYKERRIKDGSIGFPQEKIDRSKSVNTRRQKDNYKHMIGYKFSEESKSLQSEKAKLREKVECPHCKKLGPKPQMGRWHFDNCKEKLKCV